MAVFLISVVVFAVVMAVMAVGVMAGRQPIKGSCGGLGAVGINQSCEICGGDPQRCDEESGTSGAANKTSAPFYNAYNADKS